MKKFQEFPLALVILFAAFCGFWTRGWVEEWRIQRQFDRALDCFSADSTDFTLSYESDCGENLSVQSSQLTFKEKQIVEQYVHSLECGRFYGYPIGGQITVQYWPSNRQIFSAGSLSRLDCLETGRTYRRSCESSQDELFQQVYELLKEKSTGT